LETLNSSKVFFVFFGDWLIGDWLIGDWLIGDWLIGDWLIGKFVNLSKNLTNQPITNHQ
jgi:hypothetical protein